MLYRFPYSVKDPTYGDFDDFITVDLESFESVEAAREKVIDALVAEMLEEWEPEFIDCFWQEGFSDEDSAREYLKQCSIVIREPEPLPEDTGTA